MTKFISVIVLLTLVFIDLSYGLDFPPGITEGIKVPFVYEVSRVVNTKEMTGNLIPAGEFLNFMTKGAGESFTAGKVNFSKPGEYRVFAYLGAGWAKGTGPHDRFVLELNGQPTALLAAKGTGGASNMEWVELNRFRIGKPGPYDLVWRHIATGRPRIVQYIINGVIFSPAIETPRDAKKPAPVQIGRDGWIRTWLVGGCFGMGGLSSIAPFCEKYFTPLTGMEWDQYYLDYLLRVTWREYLSPEDKISFDLSGTFADRPAFEWPVGRPGSAYAHVYVTIPSQRDILLDFESARNAEVFLNGDPVRPDHSVLAVDAGGGFERRKDDPPFRTPVTLQGGPNRLMIKLYFPQSRYRPKDQRGSQPTWFRCRFLDLDGTPIIGSVTGTQYAQANAEGFLRFQLNPPDLLVPEKPVVGRRLGDLTELTYRSDKPYDAFLTGDPVILHGKISLMDGLKRLERFGFNEQSFDAGRQQVIVHWLAYDFDGKIVGRDSREVNFNLARPGEFEMDLGKLGRGHYTIYSEIRQGTKLVCPARPKMVVVVDPPTLPKPGVHSKFAHSFYYLMNGTEKDDDLFLPLLALAKVRLQIGCVHDWWIEMHPKDWVALPADKRTWPREPKKERLERAKRMAIELVGQVGGFYPGRICPPFNSDPKNGDHLIINRCWDIGLINSPEAEKIVDTYVYETVKKYKGYFRYWRMGNEMNNREFTPAELTHLHTLCARAMKRADPNAKLWGGSISSFDIPYVDKMVQLGYDRDIAVHDYHYYIWPQEDPTYRDMGGLPELLAIFNKYHVKKPIANGEFGCYRSIHHDGARVQAAMFTRALTVAHTYNELQWIAPHFWSPLEWAVNSEDGLFPAFLAYRTAADMLEGAKPAGMMHLGEGIAAYRFKRPSGKTVIVLWDPKNREVKIPGVDKTWTGFDLLGRKLKTPADGSLKLSVFPIYLTDGQLEEGTERTSLK
jgi:hypothetical protein